MRVEGRGRRPARRTPVPAGRPNTCLIVDTRLLCLGSCRDLSLFLFDIGSNRIAYARFWIAVCTDCSDLREHFHTLPFVLIVTSVFYKQSLVLSTNLESEKKVTYISEVVGE